MVDPISLLVTIGAITAISLFLRQAVIDNNIMARKRKKRSKYNLIEDILKGMHDLCFKILLEHI